MKKAEDRTEEEKQWAQPAEYARRCGLTSPRSITQRIARGSLPCREVRLLDGSVVCFINLLDHPPTRGAGGRGIRKPPRPPHGGYTNPALGEKTPTE